MKNLTLDRRNRGPFDSWWQFILCRAGDGSSRHPACPQTGLHSQRPALSGAPRSGNEHGTGEAEPALRCANSRTAGNRQRLRRFPPGAKITGHVSRIEPAGFAGRARLWLTFDEIETRHGKLPIVAEVVSVPGEYSVRAGESREGEIEARGGKSAQVVEATAGGAAMGSAAGISAHNSKAAATGRGGRRSGRVPGGVGPGAGTGFAEGRETGIGARPPAVPESIDLRVLLVAHALACAVPSIQPSQRRRGTSDSFCHPDPSEEVLLWGSAANGTVYQARAMDNSRFTQNDHFCVCLWFGAVLNVEFTIWTNSFRLSALMPIE